MDFIKKNSLFLILGIGVIGVLLATYYEGNATMRWGQKYDTYLQSFKDAVENAVPTHVGVWQADLNEDQIGIDNELIRRVAGAEGSLARHFRGSYDTPDVHINITCGFSRSVGAHTPDVCFTGSGSEQKTEVETFEIFYPVTIPNPENPRESIQEERSAKFKTAIFSDPAGHYEQRVFWGWKGMGTDWIAPKFPRLKWNSSEPICKMYVSIIEGSKTLEGQADTLKIAEEFLKNFLPELDLVLTGEYVLPEGLKTLALAREEEKKMSTVNSASLEEESSISKNSAKSETEEISPPTPKETLQADENDLLDIPENEKSAGEKGDELLNVPEKAKEDVPNKNETADEFDLDL